MAGTKKASAEKAVAVKAASKTTDDRKTATAKKVGAEKAVAVNSAGKSTKVEASTKQAPKKGKR